MFCLGVFKGVLFTNPLSLLFQVASLALRLGAAEAELQRAAARCLGARRGPVLTETTKTLLHSCRAQLREHVGYPIMSTHFRLLTAQVRARARARELPKTPCDATPRELPITPYDTFRAN